MKLQDYDKNRLEFLILKITQACDIAKEAHISTETKDKEGVILFHFASVADVIYKEMLGVSIKQVTSYFGTPGSDTVAWYEDPSKGKKRSGSLEAPQTKEGRYLICYIPDCIMDVIVSSQLDKHEKHELLRRMMSDLAKLYQAYEFKKQLFQEPI